MELINNKKGKVRLEHINNNESKSGIYIENYIITGTISGNKCNITLVNCDIVDAEIFNNDGKITIINNDIEYNG